MSASGTRGTFAAAGLSAILALFVSAMPVALAEQGGGTGAAAGHDESASLHNGAAPKDAAPRGHGPAAAPQPRSDHSTPTGKGVLHVGARHHPGGDARNGTADLPAINATPPPVARVTTRPIKDLLPKPFRAASPPVHVRRPPAFAIAIPARNAIGIPLDRPPIAKLNLTAGVNPAAKSPGAASPIGGIAALHPGNTSVPPLSRNPGLSGTTLRRVGIGPATVGGAARFTTGINGTSFRPKHGN